MHIDDTVIYGSTVEDFLMVLDQILSRMAAFNVKLKSSKCSFGMQSIEFLGHIFIFDENGVKFYWDGKLFSKFYERFIEP